MPRKQWVFDPNSGGKKIPESKNGQFIGKPEDAFAASAMYLN